MQKNDIKGDFVSKVSFEIAKPEKSRKIYKKRCSTQLITFINKSTRKEQRKTKQCNLLDISYCVPLFL